MSSQKELTSGTGRVAIFVATIAALGTIASAIITKLNFDSGKEKAKTVQTSQKLDSTRNINPGNVSINPSVQEESAEVKKIDAPVNKPLTYHTHKPVKPSNIGVQKPNEQPVKSDPNKTLVRDFEPPDIPYAVGQRDGSFFTIKFSEATKSGCPKPYQCTMQPFCHLPVGNYKVEFTYRAEALDANNSQIQGLFISVKTWNPGAPDPNQLKGVIVEYDAFDYKNGKLKITSLPFYSENESQNFTFSVWDYAMKWILYLKSIKVYAIHN